MVIDKKGNRSLLYSYGLPYLTLPYLTLPYQFAYLFTDLVIGLPLWVVLFLFRKDLRHKMLAFSLLGAIAGPISEIWYIQDYWKPLTFNGWSIGLEDVLFGFFVGGIGSIIYEEIFGKRIAKRHTRTHHWILLIFPLMIALLIVFDKTFPQYRLNSIYVSFIAFVATAAIILYQRKDLFVDSIISGLIGGAIFFFGYLFLLHFFPQLFEKMWLLKNISGVRVQRIPIEELMWAFSYGLMVGPIYECYAGLVFQKHQMKQLKKKQNRKK